MSRSKLQPLSAIRAAIKLLLFGRSNMDTTCWQYYPSLLSRRIKLYRRQINTVRYTITECNLGGALKTTVLSAILPRCGTGCCPFGFTCNSSGNCVMNANQDIFDDSLVVWWITLTLIVRLTKFPELFQVYLLRLLLQLLPRLLPRPLLQIRQLKTHKQ